MKRPQLNPAVTAWLADHETKVFLGVGATMLTIGLATLGTSMTQPGADETSEQVESRVTVLEGELSAARSSLTSKHTDLLNQLSGSDVGRVDRDRGTARFLALLIAKTSNSPEGAARQQADLAAKYDFLAADGSRALSQFLPGWVGTTAGTDYRLTDVAPRVLGVKGLTYDYFTLARLDPIEGQGKPEFLVMTYTTEDDGTIRDFAVSRASNGTRDAYLTDPSAAPIPSG